MLLVASRAIARAHGAGIELPAMAVVVAHLDRFGESPGLIAARTGCGRSLGHRVVLDIPGRPVQNRLERDGLVGSRRGRWREAKQRDVIHLRWGHDLARVE